MLEQGNTAPILVIVLGLTLLLVISTAAVVIKELLRRCYAYSIAKREESRSTTNTEMAHCAELSENSLDISPLAETVHSSEATFLTPNNVEAITISVQTHNTSVTSTSVQTEAEKELNILDFTGKPFKNHHIFSSDNKTLQLKDSLVTLTLPEEDLCNQTYDCYASTFQNIFEVYEQLTKGLIDSKELVASPVIEYFFPAFVRLTNFACVSTERMFLGKHAHVWKVDRDIGGRLVRTEILPRKLVDVKSEDLEAYYEEVNPGVLKVYIKTFGAIMITECDIFKDFFELSATVFTEEVDEFVYVKLFFMDRLFQLEDYWRHLDATQTGKKQMERRVTLPEEINLSEDKIRVTLGRVTDYKNWELVDEESEDITIKAINECPRVNEQGVPVVKIWRVTALPGPDGGIPTHLTFAIDVRCVYNYKGYVNTHNRGPPENVYYLEHKIESRAVRTYALERREAVIGAAGGAGWEILGPFEEDPLINPIQTLFENHVER